MKLSTTAYDTIIIGGGPAGLFSAINISQGSVLLLEKGEKPGRKLLIAGTGQCNYSHAGSMSDFLHHYGENHRFLKYSLNKFTNTDLVNFFKESGLESTEDKNGKIFPSTLRSSDVLNVLIEASRKNNVHMLEVFPVSDVTRNADGFIVKTATRLFSCRNLIIATGGLSYPATGSTGDGYSFAKTLGHSIVKTRPALSPIIVQNYRMAHLMGISLQSAMISLFRDGKKADEHRGDIVFTHKGLSGPGIIDFSRSIVSGDILKINFLNLNPDSFSREFIEAAKSNGKLTIQLFLKPFNLPRNLLRFLIEDAGAMPDQQIAEVSRQTRLKLAENLCEYPFFVEKLAGFKYAMSTAGGINLAEVSPKTMESKLVKNLYFAGEVLDIDGDTGGYNIQAAFSTAYVAASAINLTDKE
ncbi:MAG: NAD(P)/FAD-dependent oxidoreductase [Lentimicrobium sp.]|nr:NAD(P)/FAD-dependent oxidoreductase [Lentimicrobium sp.]